MKTFRILSLISILILCSSFLLSPGYGNASSTSEDFTFYAVYDRLVDTDVNGVRVYHSAMSGDGRKLIFSGADTATGEPVVYTLNSDGSGLTRISLPSGFSGDIPEVVINRNGSRAFFYDRAFHLIFKVEGGTAIQILDTNDYEEINACRGIETTASGDYLYFQEDRDDLWRVSHTGGTPEKVIEDTGVPRQDSNGNNAWGVGNFAVSSDGGTILFECVGYADPTNYYGVTVKRELFVKSGGGYLQLTNDIEVHTEYFDISGDGSMIVYNAGKPESKWYSVRSDGSAKTTLEDLHFNIAGVMLTYDGSKAFYRDDGAHGGSLLYTDGSARFDILPEQHAGTIVIDAHFHPNISEDGSRVSFIFQYASFPFKEALYVGYLNYNGEVPDAPVIENMTFEPGGLERGNPEARVVLEAEISDPQGLEDIERTSTDELLEGIHTYGPECPAYFYFAVHDDGSYPDAAAGDGVYSSEGQPGETINTIDKVTVRVGAMDKTKTVVVADTILPIGTVLPTPPEPEPDKGNTGVISGKITSITTGEPVAGVTVSVGQVQTITDDDGTYVLIDIPAGTMSITASKAGYSPVTKSVNLVASTSMNLEIQLAVGDTSDVWLEYIYCAGINVGWARLGIHMYQGANEPWNDSGVRSCIDDWMRRVIDYHNTNAPGLAPWRWTQYGALVGKGFVSQQAPDNWNSVYQGNLYKWMWLEAGRTSYPGIRSIINTCSSSGAGQSITDIIAWLNGIAYNARASGFPFTNYESTIATMVNMLSQGATMPEVAKVFDNWEPGYRAQLRDKGCSLGEGQPQILLEYIYTAGINIGWARLGIHLGAARSDIVDWLNGVISSAKASNFPFVNYEDPINNMINMINSGATMYEVAKVFDPWEPGFRAQLKRSCTLGEEPSLPDSFDWRDRGVIAPIKNQARCGSCWAFSAAGTVEGTYCVEQNLNANAIDLSEQNMVSMCCNAGCCNGGWPSRALEYIRSTGIVDEACFPYQSQNCKYTNPNNQKSECCDGQASATFGCTDCECPDGSCSNPCPCNGCADWNNRLWQIQRWQKVQNNVQDIQRALVDNGPLSVTSGNWGHAIILVGYDNNSTIGLNQYGQAGCWIIRNSWGLFNGWANIVDNKQIIGRVWHVDGYGYIPYTGHVCSDIMSETLLADGVTAP